MIIPMLVCLDAGAEVEFCRAAFGAVELSRRSADDGTVVHATLSVGDSLLMVHSVVPHLASRAPLHDGTASVVVYIYLENVDTVIDQAVRSGAQVLNPPADQFWGDRVGRILDPAGHVWNVATRRAS